MGGSNYAERKVAKKRRKALAAADANQLGKNSKRNPHSKRTGMCWGAPLLTQADLLDSAAANTTNAPSVTEAAESNRARRRRTGGAVAFAQAAPGSANLRPSSKKLRTKRPGLVLSTAIPLLGQNPGGPAVEPTRTTQEEEHALPATPSTKGGETSRSIQFHPLMSAYLANQRLQSPTRVQELVWQASATNPTKNIVAVAPPGSGKTLAALLPLAAWLQESSRSSFLADCSAPGALMLLPTRELAVQSTLAAKPLQRLAGLRTVCVHGGVPLGPQVEQLGRRPAIIIATPGRLLEHVDAGTLSLVAVQAIAIDECDKLLSLGFAQQLARLGHVLLPSQRGPVTSSAGRQDASADKLHHKQARACTSNAACHMLEGSVAAEHSSAKGDGQALVAERKEARVRHSSDKLLVPLAAEAGAGRGVCEPAAVAGLRVIVTTATLPASLHGQVAAWVGPEAEWIELCGGPGADDVAAAVSPRITQVVHVCAEHKKLQKLCKHLRAIADAHAGQRLQPRILIFCNKIKTVQTVAGALAGATQRVGQLHGDLEQQQRTRAVADFSAGKSSILLATDVAARGLNIRGLPYIVNYDFPSNLDVYLHRIGRTGRLAADGHAFAFFTRNLVRLAPPLCRLLQDTNQAIDPNLVKLADAHATIQQMQLRTTEGVQEAGKECDTRDAQDAAAVGSTSDGEPAEECEEEDAEDGRVGGGEGARAQLLAGKHVDNLQKKPMATKRSRKHPCKAAVMQSSRKKARVARARRL